jgi:hypothetical protein
MDFQPSLNKAMVRRHLEEAVNLRRPELRKTASLKVGCKRMTSAISNSCSLDRPARNRRDRGGDISGSPAHNATIDGIHPPGSHP